jgi:Spy/CpxP family protein refolding chaperone
MRFRYPLGISALIAVLAVPFVMAQVGGPPEGGRPGWGRMRGGPGPMWLPEEMARRLAENLQLTPEQQAQYDEIVAKYADKWGGGAGQSEEMARLREQFREARQAGDDARAEELGRQMRELGGARMQVFRDFLNEVRPILTDEQRARLDEFRESWRARGRGMAEEFGRWREMIRQVRSELQLTDEQNARLDELLAEQRAAMAARREELRPLWEELRAARRAGDEQRVAELEEQLRQQGPLMGNVEELFQKFEPALTDEQKEKLAELKERFTPRGQAVTDVRQVLQAARRLDLRPDQRQRIREISEEAATAARRARDNTARAKLAADVKQQILALLDTDQATRFEELLSRAARQAPRRGAGMRGEEGNPPGYPDQPRRERARP